MYTNKKKTISLKTKGKEAFLSRKRKLQLRRLIDSWTPTVLLLFSFVKFLQGLRLLGFYSQEGGWRKATRSFLRTEHSKFSLTAFRLTFWSDVEMPRERDAEKAKEQVIRRLGIFLKKVPASYWRIKWAKFSARRIHKEHIDITEAIFDAEGRILCIKPYLDIHAGEPHFLTPEKCARIDNAITAVYNTTKDYHDKMRPWILREELYRWLLLQNGIPKKEFHEARRYIERILSSTFIHFDVLSRDHSEFDMQRFRDPEFIKRKHPGQGIFNVLCRFNAHLDQADLWIQINHVPVDGVPMQEMLVDLKKEWGTAGDLKYPSLAKQRRMEPILCTTKQGLKGMYHAHRFIDFGLFLDLRKELNNEHASQIGGQVTAVSMLLWGLAHNAIFADKKFVFTVELSSDSGEERSAGLVFIRPSKFIDLENPRAGFLNFQIELNQQIEATRARRSESYEFLELSALTSPLVYWILRKCIPKALAEFVGTIGLTMIKDADIFLSPLSDINTDGFLAFGHMARPTVDGKTAGYVSARAPRDKVNAYLDAVENLALNFKQFV